MIEWREQRTVSGKPGAAAGTAGASFALFSHQPRRSSIIASVCCLLDDREGWHATAASARFAVQQLCCWCCWCCQSLQAHTAACYMCAPITHLIKSLTTTCVSCWLLLLQVSQWHCPDPWAGTEAPK